LTLYDHNDVATVQALYYYKPGSDPKAIDVMDRILEAESDYRLKSAAVSRLVSRNDAQNRHIHRRRFIMMFCRESVSKRDDRGRYPNHQAIETHCRRAWERQSISCMTKVHGK